MRNRISEKRLRNSVKVFGNKESAAIPRPEEIFWKQDESAYFTKSLLENLKRHLAQGLEEELARSVQALIFHISVSLAALNVNITVLSSLYLWSIAKLLQSFPLTLAPDLELADLTALFDEHTMERYAAALQAQGLEEEANYVREQFARWVKEGAVRDYFKKSGEPSPEEESASGAGAENAPGS